MTKPELMICLTKVRSSTFYRCDPKELEDYLTHSVAVRYLTQLCMVNERDKSDLRLVDEAGSSQEESSASNRDDFDLEMAISSLARSSLEQQANMDNVGNENIMPQIQEPEQDVQNLLSDRI